MKINQQELDWEALGTNLESDTVKRDNGCWEPRLLSCYKRFAKRQWRYRTLWWMYFHHSEPGFDINKMKNQRLYALCMNYDCCNPDHTGSNPNSEGRPRGEEHGQAKLTAPEVMEIKRRLLRGETYQHIAKSYPNVTFGAIAGIATERSWRHVTVPEDTVAS